MIGVQCAGKDIVEDEDGVSTLSCSRGDPLRVQGYSMSVYEGLGDREFGDSRLEQVSANCKLSAQSTLLPLSIKLCWNTVTLICFHL